MEATVNRLPQTNGSPAKAPRKPAKRSRRKGKAMAAPMPRLALGLTLGAGVGIPGLTLALSTIAGRLAAAGYGSWAGAVGAVGGTVLVVSLSHLAWAVGNIT